MFTLLARPAWRWLGSMGVLAGLVLFSMQCTTGGGGGVGPGGMFQLRVRNQLFFTNAHLTVALPNPPGETPGAANLLAPNKARDVDVGATRPANGNSFEFRAYIPPDLINPVATIECFVTANAWVSNTPASTLTATTVGGVTTYSLSCDNF